MNEKIEKIKKIFLAIFTFICMIVLVLDIVCFAIKKTSEQYLKEDKIKSVIKGINVVDLLIDKNGNELEELGIIKDKLIEAGIPSEATNAFINSTPVNNYTSDLVSKSLDNTLNGKNEDLVKNGEVYNFLENNIETISEEMQEKNVPHSDILTKDYQEKFLDKIESKTPIIEEKINKLQNKIYNKLDQKNYLNKLDKIIKVVNFLYGIGMDILLIIIFIIFIMGIVITRKSLYKSLKWIGISFISSGIILKLIPKLIIKIYKYIDKLPNMFANYVKKAIDDMFKTFNKYMIILIIIGIILILINFIIYYMKEKRLNKKIKML